MSPVLESSTASAFKQTDAPSNKEEIYEISVVVEISNHVMSLAAVCFPSPRVSPPPFLLPPRTLSYVLSMAVLSPLFSFSRCSLDFFFNNAI